MPVIKRKSFISNEKLDKVINNLDEYMKKTPKWSNFNIELTSGYRTPEVQLTIIESYAIKNKIKFPEFDPYNVSKKVIVDGKNVYCWQRTWSKLLNIGIIVNPCFDAECLFDYIVGGVNKKGQIIKQSTHMQGRAFDMSGNVGLDKEKELIEDAMKAGVGIISYLIERNNNAAHCNIK